ncbi:MAG TPA: NAD(P)/FAD-dependent oxidoreductase [Clostridiales bacterium]|nr:NAD(P)/FAD-dependent oxidoreductase [Clostridiales bacterium]
MNSVIVIIGGGVAAVSAIKGIREHDKTSNIYLIQNENFYPYYRLRLTKNIFDNVNIDQLILQKKEWYEDNNITLYLGRETVSVDTKAQQVTLDNGVKLNYSSLLLANGASNFVPTIEGIHKDNVYSIRYLTDIDDIRSHASDKNSVLFIGGGVQNLEAAWVMCSQGKKVTIAEFMDRLMPRQLDVIGSELLKKAVEDCGAKILLGTEVTKLIGDDKVSRAQTKDGKLVECDMVIYSVGVRANIGLYKNSPIKVNRGVLVDDHMRTSEANIYAAGDVAEFGRYSGLWTIAMEQGKIAGQNIGGNNVSFTGVVPVTNMKAFNLLVFSIGDIDENSFTHTLVESSEDENIYKRIFIKDNIIIGAIIIGESKDSYIIKKFIDNQTLLKDIDFSNISVGEFITHLRSIK